MTPQNQSPPQPPNASQAPNSQLPILLCVEADRLDGGDHHNHAQCDRDKQHDHMLRPVLEGQLFLQARWPPGTPTAGVAVGVLLTVFLAVLAPLWETIQ